MPHCIGIGADLIFPYKCISSHWSILLPLPPPSPSLYNFWVSRILLSASSYFTLIFSCVL
jgi:hypothetical protein